MRKWKVVALLLALGLAFAPLASAQQDDDLRKEVDQLRRDLAKVLNNQAQLQAENAELRTKLDTTATPEASLEAQINALAESMDYAAGTTVKSVANPITIDGEFRTRWGASFDRDFGADFGDNDLEDDEGTWTDARFLVGFTFEFDRDVIARVAFQATGLYGNGDTPAENRDNDFSGGGDLSDVDLYEGWIHFNNVMGRKELSTRTGRQEIVLGNEFQFGNNDFFAGETFDGTHVMWDSDSFAVHFLALKLSTQNPDAFNTRDHPYIPFGAGDGYDDDELYSLYFTLKTIENHELDVYWIYFNGHNGGTIGTLGNHLGSISTGDNTKGGPGLDFYYHTVGARIGGVFPSIAAGLDWNLEGAYQFGDLSGANIDVDGWAVEFEVGITFNPDSLFRLFARVYFAEGGDNSETGYIPLFPERHAQANGDHTNYRARYGLMDIIPMDNVFTAQVGLTFDPATDWTLGLTVLYAQHDEDVATPAGSDDSLGWEIDVFAEYRYSDQTTISLGIGVFLPEEGAPLKGGGFAGNDDDIAFLGYIQTRIVF